MSKIEELERRLSIAEDGIQSLENRTDLMARREVPSKDPINDLLDLMFSNGSEKEVISKEVEKMSKRLPVVLEAMKNDELLKDLFKESNALLPTDTIRFHESTTTEECIEMLIESLGQVLHREDAPKEIKSITTQELSNDVVTIKAKRKTTKKEKQDS